jgi:5-methyltetrahydropteroyltriglutamate--homocysteine methyltransferase
MLPTTQVGSLPKPEYLAKARTQFNRGEITATQLHDLELQATRECIALQEEVGLDVFVHGEMERGDMVAYFAENWQGFGISTPVRSYGNRYYKKPVIEQEVGASGPLTLEMWKYAQSLTEKPVKGMLTGPYTIYEWSFDEYYPTRRDGVMALAKLVRAECEALRDAGCKYIQIDEPAIPTRPEEIDLAISAMHAVTDDLGVETLTHMCYGNFEILYPKILEIPVDQIDLEFANSNFALLEAIKKHPFTKKVGLGVTDVHSHVIESKEQVKAWINRALEVFRPEQVWVDPDCGLKTRTWEESRAKLQVMVEAVREIRAEREWDASVT